MKRLDGKKAIGEVVDVIEKDSRKPKRLKNNSQKESVKGPKNFLKNVLDRDEAVEAKIKRTEGRILGVALNKFDIGTVTDVWVPYCMFRFHYEFKSSSKLLQGGGKAGDVIIIYDMNESHCSQYDELESGKLPVIRGAVPVKEGDVVIKQEKTDKEIEKDVRDYIQMKIMMKTFGHSANLTLKERVQFYRPAVELEVFFKGRNRNLRYAYLDEFAVSNEHILGMKYRLKT